MPAANSTPKRPEVSSLPNFQLPTNLSSDSLRNIARRAALRLAAVQSSTGALLYEYDAATDRRGGSAFNMVRMAGATYSLCWAATVFAQEACGPELHRAAAEAIGFLLLSCRLQSPQFYVGSYKPADGFSSEGALGSSGLLLNALLFPAYHDTFRSEAELLVELMLESQTPAGAFRAYPHRKWFVGPQRYYSGEAILGLIRYMHLTGAFHLLPRIEKALEFYREYFRRDPNQALVLWHADAWSRMVPAAGQSEQGIDGVVSSGAYLDFVIELVGTILPKQVKPGTHKTANGKTIGPEHVGGFSHGGCPGISTSVYLEGIARAYGACDRGGRVDLLPEYLESLSSGVDFIRRLQISEQQSRTLPNPAYSIGGCRQSLDSWALRIDNDQHVITACFAMLEVLPAELLR